MLGFRQRTRRRIAQIAVVVCASMISFGCGGGGTGEGGGGGGTTPPTPPNGTPFASPTTFSSGGVFPGSVALADFNGDGKLDIVVSNYTSNTIAVFLNKGDGKFGDPIVSPVQITAVGLGALSVGDFNEDGKPDVVIGTIAGSQANIVLLGNGDGTFQELPPIPNSSGFFHARVVDLNGDGHQDLVTSSNGGLSVFLGNGDGTFIYSPLPTLPSGQPLPSMAFLGMVVGDFNGDKKIDIVTCSPGTPAGTLLFYAGNGDGTFQVPTAVMLPPANPVDLASADFDGDGKLDLLIGYASQAAVGLGNGDGTFQIDSLLPVYSPQSFSEMGGMVVQTADFDLDGKPDAVVGDYYLGVLTVLLNKGIGQIPPPAGTQYQFALAPGLADIATGDLNGDGIPDIVVVNATTNQVTVILSIKQ